MPSELTVKLRSYFRNTMHLIRSRRYEGLLQKMSTRLRGDAAYRMCEFRLRTVPFLVHPDLEPEFMCNLAIKYRTCVYSRLERVPCSELFIVERGVVAKRGRLGLSGACFGKDVILSNDNLRDIGDAIALTFVQTISLTQRDIFELLPDYPKAFYTVRKAALRMALVRALCKAAQIVKQSNLEKRGKSLIEIFDLAMIEANSLVEQKKRVEEARKKRTIPLSLSKSVDLLASFKKSKEQQHRITKVGKWGKIGGGLSRLPLSLLLSADCSCSISPTRPTSRPTMERAYRWAAACTRRSAWARTCSSPRSGPSPSRRRLATSCASSQHPSAASTPGCSTGRGRWLSA